MTVAVLVPFGGSCPYRAQAWEWVQAKYATEHPDWELVTGTTAVDGFSRTQAILDARSRTDADVLVVADADVWCDPQPAVEQVPDRGWAIPQLLIHRLSEGSTQRVIHGADWRGQPLSTDNHQDSKPYRGREAGTLLVLTAAAFDLAPPDPRFVRWGAEDTAWALALHALVGKPWRGTDHLVHLWHPAEPRQNRVVGNEANQALLQRYRLARHRPERMRTLIEEARHGERTHRAEPAGDTRSAPLP